MILSKRIVWDAATCGGTLNYQHDEPTSFFFRHPCRSCSPATSFVRPPLLGGGVAARDSSAEGQEGEAKEEQGGSQEGCGEDVDGEEVGRGDSAGDQCAARRERGAAEGPGGISESPP